MDKLVSYNERFKFYLSQIGGKRKQFKIKSSAINDNINKIYTKYGKNKLPDVSWSGVPAGTKELLLVMYDTDADNFIYWLVSGLPAKSSSLEGKYVIGQNGYGDNEYSGPEPPKNVREHYVLALYALNDTLKLDPDETHTLKQIKRYIKNIKIGEAKIKGSFKIKK